MMITLDESEIELRVKGQGALGRALREVRPTEALMQSVYEACLKHGVKVEPKKKK